MSMATKSLEEILQELPKEARHELEDFANYLWERRGSASGPLKEKDFDFDSLLGMALKAPLNPNPRFKSDDDLWE